MHRPRSGPGGPPGARTIVRGVAVLAACLATTALAGLPAPPVPQWSFRAPAGHPEFTWADTIPVVAQLTDDDGDGRIDGNDCPDVVFMLGGRELLVRVVAVSGDTGEELWSVGEEFLRSSVSSISSALLAAADVDGDGVAELLANLEGTLLSYQEDGTPGPTWEWERWESGDRGHGLGVADLDHDGNPEVYSLSNVLSIGGTLRWSVETGERRILSYAHSLASELDAASPGMELFVVDRLYSADGQVLWIADDLQGGAPAIGDLDRDGEPEIVVVSDQRIQVLSADGSRATADWPLDDRIGHSGAPTLADIDGDGELELVVPSRDFIHAFEWVDGGLSRRWLQVIQDLTGASGASAFDFDGDGAAEVLYRDEISWYVLDGHCGQVLYRRPSPSLTYFEFPLVANIDCDPNAEIIIPGIRVHEDGLPGIEVFEVPGSCTPRAVWNQATYHVTNVDELGAVPRVEEPSWRAGVGWVQQAPAAEPSYSGFDELTVTRGQPCSNSILLTWPEAIFPSGSATYQVRALEVSPAQGCCAAVTGDVIAAGLTEPRWSQDTRSGAAFQYIVEALPPGGECARPQLCSQTVDFGEPAYPEGIGPVLRVSHDGQAVTLRWAGGRELLPHEHHHVRKRLDDPSVRGELLEAGTARELTDTDTTSPRQHFLVRAAEACHRESRREYYRLP